MISYNEETVEKLEKFVDVFLAKQGEKYKGNEAVEDKLRHIDMVTVLTAKLFPNNSLIRVAAKMHDIGRFKQFELCGAFNDGSVLHHYLGEDTIGRFLYQGQIEPSNELDIIRYVIQFHGREKFLPYPVSIPEDVKEVVSAISRIDDIENGCIGAVGYLQREARDDAKGYKKDNPDLDQKSVSKEVMEFFTKGEKFDKMKYCHTYAEYTLFAAILAIEKLKSADKDIAKMALELPGKNNETALEGYRRIFQDLISPDIADKCYSILLDYYENDRRNKSIEH